jgi:hypothetical protein
MRIDRSGGVSLWWQPFAASALLVRDPGAFAAVREESDYLDRDEDVAEG